MNPDHSRRRLLVAAALGAIAAALAACSTPDAKQQAGNTAAPPRPMNVLLIISDDLGTRMGSYGGPAQTPNIDRLAAHGVRFNNAYSQFPWCGPSRASFLTGMRPNTTKVLNLETNLRTALPDVVTLPQAFKEHGYYAGRVGKIFHQGVPGDIGTSGMDDPKSWTEVVNPRGRDRDAEDGRLVNLTPGIPLGAAFTSLADEGSDDEQTDGKVAIETIRMLQANKDKPFFIAAGFYRPHVPDVAPKKYFDRYPLASIRTAKETPGQLASLLPPSIQWTPANLGLSEEDQKKQIQSYYAAITFMDAQVGRVLDAAREMKLLDNTVVVFMSDHGYLLGEHGQWEKNLLWEEATRVPLVICMPDAKGNGGTSHRVVELVDLYPTLAELAGVPAQPGLEGRSLAPLLKLPEDGAWTYPAFSQIRGGRSVRTERWRYTEWEGGKRGAELYDLKADLGEHANLSKDPAYAATVAELRALLPKGPVEPAAQRNLYDGKKVTKLPYDPT